MNKYLARYNKLLIDLETENETEERPYISGRDYLAKLMIANDITHFDFTEELTDKGQEILIEIIFDIYMSTPEELTTYSCASAVINTIVKDFNGFFTQFQCDYETNYTETFDKIIYRLD